MMSAVILPLLLLLLLFVFASFAEEQLNVSKICFQRQAEYIRSLVGRYESAQNVRYLSSSCTPYGQYSSLCCLVERC